MLSRPPTTLTLPKPSLSLFSFSSPNFTTNLRFKNRRLSSNQRSPCLKNPSFRARSSESSSSVAANDDSVASTAGLVGGEEDTEAAQLFEKLKDAERVRIDKLEKFENKSDRQLERQLILASCWSRTLLTLQGKLKGTEWDPENSHRIDYSEFCGLLDSNNVQYMEYSNFGKSISVILPYYKDGKIGEANVNSNREVVFRRHIVDRMPIDGWNDVWLKLHRQLVNVDVINVDSVPAEVYSTIATVVVWTMRFALAVGLYRWIDNMTRPIYSKLIPCDLGTPTKKVREPLKRRALRSSGNCGMHNYFISI